MRSFCQEIHYIFATGSTSDNKNGVACVLLHRKKINLEKTIELLFILGTTKSINHRKIFRVPEIRSYE